VVLEVKKKGSGRLKSSEHLYRPELEVALKL